MSDNRERLSRNAEDFDEIVSEMLSEMDRFRTELTDPDAQGLDQL